MSSNLESSVQRKLQGTRATVRIDLGWDGTFSDSGGSTRGERSMSAADRSRILGALDGQGAVRSGRVRVEGDMGKLEG